MTLGDYVSVTDPNETGLQGWGRDGQEERGWGGRRAGWWRVGAPSQSPDHPTGSASLPALTSIWIHLLMNREDSSSIYFHVSFWGIREPGADVGMLNLRQQPLPSMACLWCQAALGVQEACFLLCVMQ